MDFLGEIIAVFGFEGDIAAGEGDFTIGDG